MNREEKLGQIESVRFGHNRLRRTLGLTISVRVDGYLVNNFIGAWDPELTPNALEPSREQDLVACCRTISLLLKQSKKESIDQLAGVPVRAVVVDGKLIHWRILDENDEHRIQK